MSLSISLLTARNILLCCVPILGFGATFLIFSLALHCRNQRNRWCLLPVYLAAWTYSWYTSEYFDAFSPRLFHLWGNSLQVAIFHHTSLLYIERWPAPKVPSASSADAAAEKYDGPPPFWGQLNFRACYKIWGNPQRLFVTGDQNEYRHSDTERDTPYSVFFFLRLIKLPIYYALQSYVVPFIFSETIMYWLPEDVSPLQETMLRRLDDVSPREIMIRGYMAIWWILECVVSLDSANSLLACFFVAIGLDKPNDWPSLFGPITSATSLRRFWSKFWNQLAVRAYVNYAKVFGYRVLGLKPGLFPFKTAVACVVFLLSGLSHAAVDWRTGVPTWHTNIWWFFLNFVGCLVETVCLQALRGFAASMKYSRELRMVEESWFGKLVGYTWVFAFFFWSVPKWVYPSIYCQFPEPETSSMDMSGNMLLEALLNAS